MKNVAFVTTRKEETERVECRLVVQLGFIMGWWGNLVVGADNYCPTVQLSSHLL